MTGNGSRVSIPNSVKKMIHNIKEITGNDSDDEIYAMLKECSMDPNETTQKLLLQDTFHEVKRKRDKRKEVTQNSNNKESAESRLKAGTKGWGSGGGRVNYLPRRASHDAGGDRNASGKENGVNHVPDKGVSPSLPTSKEAKSKDTSSGRSSIIVKANGPTGVSSRNASVVRGPQSSAGNNADQTVVNSSVNVSKPGSALLPNGVNQICSVAFGTEVVCGQPAPISSNCKESKTPPYLSAVCFSPSDPVLLPSNDIRLPSTVGTISREVESQPTLEQNATAAENKLTSVNYIAASEVGISSTQEKASSKSQGVGKNQLTENSQPSSASTHGSRPSSNYNNRSQQTIGPIKVGSSKEWKPKPTNPNVALVSGTAGISEVPTIQVETSPPSQPVSKAIDSEEATQLQKKLEELHLPQRQHVILPNHIRVSESERSNLSFGSLGASFGVTMGYTSGLESDRSSTPLSEASQVIEEAAEEHVVSNQDALKTTEEGDIHDHQQSPAHVHENISSGDVDVPGNTVPEYSESKQDTAFLSGGHQYSVVHTSPNYSYGFVPPILGNQPFENSESQAHDGSHLPSFVVQQPFDPSSYYAQFYRPGTDSEGRVSPFASSGATTKYNRNGTMLPPQSSQSPQEGGNSVALSTAGPTTLVTQAAGLLQNSIAMTQQPMPVFGPPTGMHISHYPPNYLPYGPYFSHPFYVPPPTIHQFLSNGAFPHQPQATSVYPAPPAASAPGVKYSFPPYKPGANTGNGMPSGYGAYGSSPTGYNPSSASAAGITTSNDDLGASQFKDSNVYITGQQSEGSAVWFAAPGRDISGMPETSFYNLPQGQHVTYAPTQAGHGTFAGIYHHPAVTAASVHPHLQQSQTMAVPVDMTGPAASVYHQPQHAQLNWPSNY